MRRVGESAGGRRFDQIDVLKALAIVAVVSQHGLPFSERLDSYGSLWTDQAVPVFIVAVAVYFRWRQAVRARVLDREAKTADETRTGPDQ